MGFGFRSLGTGLFMLFIWIGILLPCNFFSLVCFHCFFFSCFSFRKFWPKGQFCIENTKYKMNLEIKQTSVDTGHEQARYRFLCVAFIIVFVLLLGRNEPLFLCWYAQ